MNSYKNKLNSKKKLVFYANAKHTLELVTTLGFMVKMLWTQHFSKIAKKKKKYKLAQKPKSNV